MSFLVKCMEHITKRSVLLSDTSLVTITCLVFSLRYYETQLDLLPPAPLYCSSRTSNAHLLMWYETFEVNNWH